MNSTVFCVVLRGRDLDLLTLMADVTVPYVPGPGVSFVVKVKRGVWLTNGCAKAPPVYFVIGLGSYWPGAGTPEFGGVMSRTARWDVDTNGA